jgi:tRNA (adenine57-N1/adenine58-N1)-methyltransferase
MSASSAASSSAPAAHPADSAARTNRSLERRTAEKARLDSLLPSLLSSNAERASRQTIKEGDLVIVWESNLKYVPLIIKRNATLSNRFGHFPHNSLIGLPYGTRVHAQKSIKGSSYGQGGFVILLRPTPELWTNALTHRTQILYLADISMICLLLNIQPGSIIVESGTGSGSLSTSIARSLAPSGHLHTFEFNIERVEKAKIDFKTLGIDHLISVNHRDVCGLGFPLIDGGVDGIFLDLPSPWLCLESCTKILRIGGHLCSFSPCIEQVQRTCQLLTSLGFTDIRSFECLDRTYEVTRQSFAKIQGRKTMKKMDKRSDQQRKKRVKEEDQEENEGESQKKIKTEENEEEQTEEQDEDGMEDNTVNNELAESSLASPTDEDLNRELFDSLPTLPSNLLCTRSFLTMRGHTGFLTIAQYLDDKVDNNEEETDEKVQ